VPDLPEDKQEHCQVTIGDDQVFVTAGLGDTRFSVESGGDTFILDWNTRTWKELEPFPEILMNGAACGLANNEIVVAANWKWFIFPLDDLTWRRGPALPANVEDLVYAQIGDTFVAVGGSQYNTNEPV